MRAQWNRIHVHVQRVSFTAFSTPINVLLFFNYRIGINENGLLTPTPLPPGEMPSALSQFYAIDFNIFNRPVCVLIIQKVL